MPQAIALVYTDDAAKWRTLGDVTLVLYRRRNLPLPVAILLCLCLTLSTAAAAQPISQPISQPFPRADTTTAGSPVISSAEQVPAAGGATLDENASESGEFLQGRLLNDEELAQLAERAEEPGDQVAGGALTNQQLTYIMIALAAAVVVLIVK